MKIFHCMYSLKLVILELVRFDARLVFTVARKGRFACFSCFQQFVFLFQSRLSRKYPYTNVIMHIPLGHYIFSYFTQVMSSGRWCLSFNSHKLGRLGGFASLAFANNGQIGEDPLCPIPGLSSDKLERLEAFRSSHCGKTS